MGIQREEMRRCPLWLPSAVVVSLSRATFPSPGPKLEGHSHPHGWAAATMALYPPPAESTPPLAPAGSGGFAQQQRRPAAQTQKPATSHEEGNRHGGRRIACKCTKAASNKYDIKNTNHKKLEFQAGRSRMPRATAGWGFPPLLPYVSIWDGREEGDGDGHS